MKTMVAYDVGLALHQLTCLQVDHKYCDACGKKLETKELISFNPKTGKKFIRGWEHGNHKCLVYDGTELRVWRIDLVEVK